MEHFLKQNDKEIMKMAMLKHEETFKQQVNELHRLYRIQKILMKNNGMSKANGWIQEMGKPNLHKIKHRRVSEMEPDLDESQIELTLGPASYKQKKKSETPINSDSGPSFSSSSTGSSHTKSREDSGLLDLGLFQVPEMTMKYQNGNKIKVDFEENTRQERPKHPPWLFQVLSLNMT